MTYSFGDILGDLCILCAKPGDICLLGGGGGVFGEGYEICLELAMGVPDQCLV